MNEKIREFARVSWLDVYALGKDRAKWEDTLGRYTELVIKECIDDRQSTITHHKVETQCVKSE